MWLPHAPNSSWPSYDCITSSCSHKLARSENNQQSHQVPPLPPSAAVDWMSLSRRISTASRDWSKPPTISCQFLKISIRLHLEILPPEFGWSLSINVPGSFRNPHSVTSTEQCLTWAIPNLYKNTHRPWIRNSRGKEIIKRKGWVSSLLLYSSSCSDVLCQAFGIRECVFFGDYPGLFLEYSCSTQISLESFSILTSVLFI